MAAIAASAVSLYPTNGTAEYYPAKGNREIVRRRLKITSVTAADTATAAVLGLEQVHAAHSGFNGSSSGVVPLGVDPVNNRILIGAGPSAATIYLVVEGSVPAS